MCFNVVLKQLRAAEDVDLRNERAEFQAEG